MRRLVLCTVVVACLVAGWILWTTRPITRGPLTLSIGPAVTFKFLRPVQKEGGADWVEVPFAADTAREIVSLLEGAEPFVVESFLRFQWDWPPIQRVVGPSPQFVPDNAVIEVYEKGGELCCRIGLLLIERRIVHVSVEKSGRFIVAEPNRTRLFDLLRPLLVKD
ncbi:MAG: hypothetical protein L0Y72_28640 [Gemmataceae bacterium]|nr:hypothetical protein [Gemmataceae bacterium]MCI0743016.1 hypothetical protein [Gemmataceae bacterium]